MTSFMFPLILFLAIILFPKRCFACGVCVDYNIEYYLPFFKYWIPIFIAWALLRWRGNILFHRSKGESSTKYIILSILVGFIFLIITFIMTMGSVLFPFLILFIWFLINSILISVGMHSKKSYQAPWWKNFNRVMIGFTIILVAYSYVFQFSDLARLAKFIRYSSHSGSPYNAAKQKVINIGEPAIPMVIDELIINKSGESSYKEGIYIVEQITGHNFERNKDKLLDWWNQQKKNEGK